jgi:hypothetical protein
VVPEAQGQLSPELMQFRQAIFPGQIPEHPVAPNALDGDVIDLEGHELRIITVGQSDTSPSTIVHIPSLAAVIAGDVATRCGPTSASRRLRPDHPNPSADPQFATSSTTRSTNP